MYPNKLFKIGKKLGMNKKDINLILSNKSNQMNIVEYISAVDSYKGLPGRYGTISLKYI